MSIKTSFPFDNTFGREMEGYYVEAKAAHFPEPELLALNEPLAKSLGLDPQGLREEGHLIFSGQSLPDGAHPIAQVYAGHQFGGLNPQLGDGRAMMIGEVVDRDGIRRDIQLKGSGPTPFSRGGDGKAAIGPVLREYLLGEAMHALGVPTTRMLAAVATGGLVYREEALPGAVVTRVAASHLRVGTFAYFAVRQDEEGVRELAEYAIARHFPSIPESSDRYVEFLRAVAMEQATLIAKWMCLGFIHGVMNTDNMTISGETIDYGPCAFMDAYSPPTVFSSIDRQGRYAYGNQPSIGQWNLAKLAECLIPILHEEQDKAVEVAHKVLDEYVARYQQEYTLGMLRKLGIVVPEEGDGSRVTELMKLLEEHQSDYTSTLRSLSEVARGDDSTLPPRLEDSDVFQVWKAQWLNRLDEQPGGREGAGKAMDALNPVYIPRNHKVEEALEAALEDDLTPFRTLLKVVSNPFEMRPEWEAYVGPAPQTFTDGYKTFCGT